MAEKYLLTKSSEDTAALFGAFDANIRLIETAFDVRISNRRGGEGSEGDEIVMVGQDSKIEIWGKIKYEESTMNTDEFVLLTSQIGL